MPTGEKPGEIRTMVKHIAVVLDSCTQANSIAQHLLTMARPGTRIFFLIPTKTRKAVWRQACMAALLTQNSLAVQVCERQWEIETNHENRAIEQKLETLRLALLRQGTETELWIYTGSLKKALKHIEGDYPDSFAVLHPCKVSLAERFLRGILNRVGFTNSVSKASLAFRSDVTWALDVITKDRMESHPKI
jgi:hypothetical protein